MLSILLFSSLFIAYTVCWRIIAFHPTSIKPLRISRTANSTDIEELEVETTVRYVIYRWGILPVYTTDRGDLTHTHGVFLSVISVISTIIPYMIVRGSNHDRKRKDIFD